MSLLSGSADIFSGGVSSIATKFISKVFGANNATPYQDCANNVPLLGYAGTIAKYPQCQSILGSNYGGLPQAPAVPVAPVPQTPNLPSPVPGTTNVNPLLQSAAFQVPALSSLPGAGTVARAAGQMVGTAARVAGGLMKRYPTAVGIVGGFLVDAAGNLIRDVFGRPVHKKHRRMNPLNHRALRRALRRVKAARHICQQVEREMPHRRSHRSKGACRPKCH